MFVDHLLLANAG